MRYWEKAETKLPTFNNQKQKKQFMLKIRLLATSFLLFALSIVRIFIDLHTNRIENYEIYFSGTLAGHKFFDSLCVDV